ncbi:MULTISPECIES: Abi family protein [Empedobacter]|nr:MULTISPECIES: Abi family protein [Empedobacter]MDH0660490.1 Abi family protein [Empedobacter sp. GD03865]MDH0674642.1 Abi family protein [Empedobacter sp. GD03861]MDH1603518.1 Abi family protein [Empedobacter sp. GD03739]MDH1883842.1 Abi family protein [Empedobacter sp. GD03797]MDM1043067.1 Abi family protein [Empedobacter brevis]
MGNIVNSINDQIQKFKDRKLNISCYEESKLKEILLDIGYYRLGFYCYYYYDKNKNEFDQNIKISDIVNLYYLDIDLKYLLLKYINRIEINFRTKLIYYVSMKYKDNPYWYVDENIMSEEYVKDFKEKIYTEKFKTENLALKKHHEKPTSGDYAPCWKVFEYLTFGSIITIFNNIKDEEVRQRVCDKYNIKHLNKFNLLLNSVRLIRNICAHSGVLFDYSLPKSVSTIPQINFNKGDRNSLDTSIKIIGFFIENISVNRYQDFQDEIKDFFETRKKDTVLASVIKDRIKYLD